MTVTGSIIEYQSLISDLQGRDRFLVPKPTTCRLKPLVSTVFKFGPH